MLTTNLLLVNYTDVKNALGLGCCPIEEILLQTFVSFFKIIKNFIILTI